MRLVARDIVYAHERECKTVPTMILTSKLGQSVTRKKWLI